MSSLSTSPSLLKGALVSAPVPGIPQVIVFQYNPARLTRSLNARTQDGAGRPGPVRLQAVPNEVISMDVEMDAADQLEKGGGLAGGMGLHPQLAALENLLYPSSLHVISNQALLAAGVLEVVPPPAPFTLFVYGVKRILPVRITDLRITEEAHDPALNPLRASVALNLTVLSTNDYPLGNPGNALFMAHHVAKEVMAKLNTANSIGAAMGSDVPLI